MGEYATHEAGHYVVARARGASVAHVTTKEEVHGEVVLAAQQAVPPGVRSEIAEAGVARSPSLQGWRFGADG